MSTRPTPAMPLDGYHDVVIVTTGTVADHLYRRGSRHTVDAATLAALRDGGLVAPEGASPAVPR